MLIGTLILHTALIYAETVVFGHCLVYSPFEVMTLIAFTVTLTYLIVEMVTGERGTGFFFLAIALLFQIISGMFGMEPGTTVDASLLEDVVGLHISAAIFGYTAFTMSAVWGGLYLAQHHEIRANRFGPLYRRLPSLGLLERMSAIAVGIGVFFLAVAVTIAFLWLPDVIPGFRPDDPKVIATITIGAIYLLALVVRRFTRVGARRFIIITLVGFTGMLLSLTVVNRLLSRFHDFG